jgi:hypothetical protein
MMKLLRPCDSRQIARGNYLRLNLLTVNALSIPRWYNAAFRKGCDCRCRWTTDGVEAQKDWRSAGCGLNLLWESRRFDADEISAQLLNFRVKFGASDDASNFEVARFCNKVYVLCLRGQSWASSNSPELVCVNGSACRNRSQSTRSAPQSLLIRRSKFALVT